MKYEADRGLSFQFLSPAGRAPLYRRSGLARAVYGVRPFMCNTHRLDLLMTPLVTNRLTAGREVPNLLAGCITALSPLSAEYESPYKNSRRRFLPGGLGAPRSNCMLAPVDNLQERGVHIVL